MIQKTNKPKEQYLKIFVYGESGIGKTYLAKTMDNVLVLSIEHGLLTLQDEEIDFIDLNLDEKQIPLQPKDKYKFWMTVLNTLKTKKDYKWIMLDSFTELSNQLYSALYPNYLISTHDGKQRIDFSMYNEFFLKIRSLLSSILSLPYNIVVTGHPTFDQESKERKIETYGKMKNILPSFFDEVFFYTKKTNTKNETQRVLITQLDEYFYAKDRSNKLDQYEMPNIENIYKKIRGEDGVKVEKLSNKKTKN